MIRDDRGERTSAAAAAAAGYKLDRPRRWAQRKKKRENTIPMRVKKQKIITRKKFLVPKFNLRPKADVLFQSTSIPKNKQKLRNDIASQRASRLRLAGPSDDTNVNNFLAISLKFTTVFRVHANVVIFGVCVCVWCVSRAHNKRR